MSLRFERMWAHDVRSASWDGPSPTISVVIPTYRRSGFLPDLVSALESQDLEGSEYEVVIVDDGSDDGSAGTWPVLEELVRKSPARVLAVRASGTGGPTQARNTGAAASRGWVIAFTDDDCLPTSRWLRSLLERAEAGADLVQGRTLPAQQGDAMGWPWARTITIERFSPLFETCNVAYRRDWFERLGGFDELDPLTALGGGRHFGEDAVLGGRLAAAGGKVLFCADALVYHRWLPGHFANVLRARRRLAGFPGLAKRNAVLADSLWCGFFLTRRTAAFDLAFVGVVVSILFRRTGAIGLVVPWLFIRWPDARARRSGRPTAVRLGQLAVVDLVGLVSLAQGSVRHRRLVL